MPFTVQNIGNIYRAEKYRDMNVEDALESFLNTMEAEGHKMMGVIPDHRTWDDQEVFAGFTGSMIVFHKE